jgi:hypothetical protein
MSRTKELLVSTGVIQRHFDHKYREKHFIILVRILLYFYLKFNSDIGLRDGEAGTDESLILNKV